MLIGSAGPVFAQTPEGTVDIGGHVSGLRLKEFDVTDTGIGINATWQATPIIALDGAFTWFPGNDGTAGRRIEHQQRVLGVIGARTGIRRGPVELFGRARGGFLRFSELDGAVCVAVTTVPLPLECQIATGYTAFVTDFGGGISVAATRRLRVHVDAGDLMVRYGQEAHRSNGELANGFVSHNVQVSTGVVWRF